MLQFLLAIIYLAFVSLGLPDALLGSAWPSMYPELRVPVSCAGIISMIIALGTILSSLMSERLTLRLGTGKVTAFSVAVTAAALMGFSNSGSFAALCLWAVPYGLGAGSVDACLNHYVALHYESRHMNWLHCMWGIGASAGPYIMGYILTTGGIWNSGYRIIGILQIALTLVLLCSLPLWKEKQDTCAEEKMERKALSLSQILQIPCAKEVMLCFFCYCAIEQTTGLWAASYLYLQKGISAELAAGFASMFYLGITLGRGGSGFLSIRLDDSQMVRLGLGLIGFGVLVLFFSKAAVLSVAGFILVGLGCAPIYPSMLHATPMRFGEERSQAIFGVQMASAYIGTCIMPPIFGFLAERISTALLPFYLLSILLLLIVMFGRLPENVDERV